eukprot:TRINITY_DN10412_c0_g1_i1.p1 TRINITY_DN10412_c0_g1~~TRINITY_DN10412_c0_g1_i1.p1  ORF type:complete len:272 (+),score=40.88 TRINITY_DN10412_c0_g1_i1:3-818(+)
MLEFIIESIDDINKSIGTSMKESASLMAFVSRIFGLAKEMIYIESYVSNLSKDTTELFDASIRSNAIGMDILTNTYTLKYYYICLLIDYKIERRLILLSEGNRSFTITCHGIPPSLGYRLNVLKDIDIYGLIGRLNTAHFISSLDSYTKVMYEDIFDMKFNELNNIKLFSYVWVAAYKIPHISIKRMKEYKRKVLEQVTPEEEDDNILTSYTDDTQHNGDTEDQKNKKIKTKENSESINYKSYGEIDSLGLDNKTIDNDLTEVMKTAEELW